MSIKYPSQGITDVSPGLDVDLLGDATNPLVKLLSVGKGDDDVGVRFLEEFVEVAWSTSVLTSLKRVGNEYHMDRRFHFLTLVYLTYYMPRIRVKKEYEGVIRIGWSNNITHQMTGHVSLNIGNDVVDSLDVIILDAYQQRLVRNGFGEVYDQSVGNLPHLIGGSLNQADRSWHTVLPACILNQHLPFGFTKHPRYAIPLVVIFSNPNNNPTAAFTIRPTLEISKLLRVIQKQEDGSWALLNGTSVETDIYNYIEIEDPYNNQRGNTSIPAPQMMAYYSKVPTDQAIWFQNNQGLGSSKQYEHIIDTMVSYHSDVAKDRLKIDIASQGTTIVRQMIFMAQNMDAAGTHDFSNYTNRVGESELGWPPIATVSLVNNSRTVYDNLPATHFEIMDQFYRAVSAARARGIYSISFCYDLNTVKADVGKVIRGTSHLTVNLHSGNPYDVIIGNRNGSDINYMLCLVLIMYRHLVYLPEAPYVRINPIFIPETNGV